MRRATFVVAALLTLAVAAPATPSEEWGVKELEEAAHAATEKLKEDKGQAAYDAIAGFAIDRSSQGTSAKAKVTFKENGQKVVQSYFCHVHGDHIDCH